jgi:3-methyladenine DNA glycosylase AlkD
VRLRSLGTPENVAGMARFGIVTSRAYGVPGSVLKKIAREFGKDQALAEQLWKTEVHEARMLAGLVADPKALSRVGMDRWAREFDSWDICDNCCMHLFRKTPFAWEKAVRWSGQKHEFVKRAGFALMATLAVHDKAAPDKQFRALLPVIEREAADDRNFVKKAVNWALRQIGKRNPKLCAAALKSASRLAQSDIRSARWIGSDALRELKSRAPFLRTDDYP